jgi:hypothetical protein
MNNRTKIIGNSGAMVALVMACLPAPSIAENPFMNPTAVNLLERWNPDGTYGLGLTVSAQTPPNGPGLGAVDYSAAGFSWRVNNPHLQPGNQVSIRFDFPSPVTIDKLTVTWRDANHSPGNYTWSDQSGVIVSDSGGPYPTGTLTNTFAARTVNFLEFKSSPANTAVNIFETVHLGAFLAPGQVLLTDDGVYNIMYDERTRFVRTGFNDLGRWTDLRPGTSPSFGLKPSGAASNITWELGQAYFLTGAHISHIDTSRSLSNASLQVSFDGVDFTTVWSDEAYIFRGEAAPRDKGYIVFDAPFNTDFPLAKFVRLNWGTNNNTVELMEFQLFGIAPEPSAALLLALAVALLWRRR